MIDLNQNMPNLFSTVQSWFLDQDADKDEASARP